MGNGCINKGSLAQSVENMNSGHDEWSSLMTTVLNQLRAKVTNIGNKNQWRWKPFKEKQLYNINKRSRLLGWRSL